MQVKQVQFVMKDTSIFYIEKYWVFLGTWHLICDEMINMKL